MNEVQGTKERKDYTDYYQRCAACGKMFYFSRDCNGKTVVCPYCGHAH